MSRSMSTSSSGTGAASKTGMMDPLESLIDFTDYDNYQSPTLSPTATSKSSFSRRPAEPEPTPASLLPTSQTMSGPSHQYDLYKQQTGIVPGALASTLAVNQNNTQVQGYSNFSLDYLGLGNSEELFDFNTAPSQPSLTNPDMDMDFDSPEEHSFFYGEPTINPNSMGGQEPSTLPSPAGIHGQSSTVGRLWPGMHQQAALAKAEAQQRQQQQLIQRQQQSSAQQKQPQRPKAAQPSDPIVEQKITQLLNSMRANSGSADSSQNGPLMNIPRLRKDEEDMDDDERLLASEEGKKLSSKERRQLRNKVSARAFRSRRKEYITQLESEIAGKVTDNNDLRAQNRALLDENKRLSDLTRMLLSSPSFSDFLDRLSTNPQPIPQVAPQQPQQATRQPPKDVSAYAARQHAQQHQIGMAMIPEQNMDFSMLSLDTANDGYTYQPQVYAVLETPEPTIDTSLLAGKAFNFVGEQSYAVEEKVDMPIIEKAPAMAEEAKTTVAAITLVVDEEFENDPAFALYHDSPATESGKALVETERASFLNDDLFSGIESEKVFARFELIDATEEEEVAAMAMAKIQHASCALEGLMTRLEMLTVDM